MKYNNLTRLVIHTKNTNIIQRIVCNLNEYLYFKLIF